MPPHNSSSYNQRGPEWARHVLLAAAIYNILWGSLVVLAPRWSFELSGVAAPDDALFLWQCIGMIVGVYGVGYAIASTNPFQHWPIVLVGLLGKIFGPIGFVWSYAQGTIELGFGVNIIFNDLIWWVPFTALLLAKYRAYVAPSSDSRSDAVVLNATLSDSSGACISVATLAASERPVLLIFFRHAGCCFCRELLDTVARRRAELERHAQLAFVFMEETAALRSALERLRLQDVARTFDADMKIYRAAGMRRAPLSRLFGIPEIIAATSSILRYGIGNLAGDGFMLPGSLLIHRGAVIARSLPTRAAQAPELCLWQSKPAETVRGS